MVGRRGGVTGWLDEAVDLLRGPALPWAGLLVLCSVPLRCLEVHLLSRSLSFGAAAGDYWPYLGALSGLATLALVPALWARAVFARAVTLLAAVPAEPAGDDHPSPGRTREIFRLPVGPWLAYTALALGVEIAFWLLAWLILPLPLLWLAGGAVVATFPWLTSANLWRALRETVRSLPGFSVSVGLYLLLALGWVITLLNLMVLFQLGVHAAAGLVPGVDAAWWLDVLTPENDTFALLLVAGATLLVEPVGLAALTLAAAARRSRQTGDDLFAWFRELAPERVP